MFSIKASSGPALNIWLIVSAKKQPDWRGKCQNIAGMQGSLCRDTVLRIRLLLDSDRYQQVHRNLTSELLLRGSNVWAARGAAPRGLSCAVPFAMDGLSLHYSPDKQWLKLYSPVHVPLVR